MGKKEKFYITTAIDYPNSTPHLGHAYEKTVADCLARWHRLKGDETFFLTGTDEHGKKIQLAAEKVGKQPQQFVDSQVKSFLELCKEWNISYDNFIRTTDKKHMDMCQNLFQKSMEKGDIYLGRYEGLYCTGCEAYYLEKDLNAGLCPVHGTKPETVAEESYFFKMSNYQKKWLEYVEKNPEFIYPVRRKQEIVNRVKEGLRDLSVSRTTFNWGIPLKDSPNHVIYVWFDALLNYLSGIGYPAGNYKKFWPADVQVIGKDILWFHSVIWPIMLFSVDVEPPKKIFVHGFINTVSGEKLSKSSGTKIDPIEISRQFGVDSVRYYLLREIPLGEDGNFSVQSLVKRHNAELANDLGNLLNRTLSLTEKKLGGKIPASKVDPALEKELDLKKIVFYMDSFEVHNALSEIFSFISACNKYVNDKKIWELEGKEAEDALYSVLDSLRIISILLSPFMPETSLKIAKQLNVSPGSWAEVKFNLLKPGKTGEKEILFAKMDEPKEEKESAREISVSIDKKLRDLDFKLVAAVIEGVSVKKKHEGLDKMIRETVKKTDLKEVGKSKAIQGYLELYDALGVKRDKHAVKNLVEIAERSGKLPTINTVVDSYNLVSIRKALIIGAHDLAKVKGNVKVKITDGSELYIPLGSSSKQPIPKGEYAFVDDQVVLCRLDVKQGEHTKVTPETKNVFLYIQGNKYTSDKLLEDSLKEVCENIVKYCGGSWKKIRVS